MLTIDYNSLKSKYSSFLSRRDKDRILTSFWDGALPNANLIELAAGMPNENFFPLRAIDLHIVNEPFEKPGEEGKGSVAHISRYDSPKEFPIARSFQYSETRGALPLITFAKTIVNSINKPAYDNWDVILANGSSDSMFKTFETLCDESTTVMMEEFTFSPVISNIIATGAKCVPLKMQLTTNPHDQGIDVEYLSHLLDNWSSLEQYKHLNKPKILYTIATGQNPTGMTLSMEKREKIYQLAQKHDFIIVEDDPYGYLYFPPYDPSNPLKNPYVDDDSLTNKKYISDYLVKSFLTLDTDARVIRLETFSKLFAPGLRLSFIVANKFIIDRILNYTEITTRAASGASQAIVYSTIKAMAAYTGNNSDEEQGAMFQGWIKWVMKVAGQYTHRRNITFKALFETEAYKKGLFKIIEPSAGMFINLQIAWPNEQKKSLSEITEQMDQLNRTLIKNDVKVVLGYKMAVDAEFSKDSCDFLRITVAYAKNDDVLIEASHRIGRGIQEFFANI